MIRVKRDFHTHATAHRVVDPQPAMTAAAIAHSCETLGLEMLGIGEHIQRTANHPLSSFRQLAAEYRKVETPISCFLAAEIDILDRSGTVTCSPAIKRELGIDYLLASVHAVRPEDFVSLKAYVEEETERLLGAIENCPHIEVLAHPWCHGVKWQRKGMIENWSFSLIPEDDKRRLITAARRRGLAIEINAKQIGFEDPDYVSFIRDLIDAGVLLSIGSDAHQEADLSRSLAVSAFLEDIGVEDSHLWMPYG